MNRRAFIKNAGLVAVGAGVGGLVLSDGSPAVGIGCEPTTTTTIPPTTTTVPPPTTTTTSWPAGGVLVIPGADVTALVNANPAGTTFRFTAGTHNVTRSLVVKAGNSYVADDPSSRPRIVGPGSAGIPFVVATVDRVTLKGLDVSQFGPATAAEGGAMVHRADGGGNDWLIEDCNLGNTNDTVIRWGSGWVVRRSRLHDGGRYAMHGGGLTGEKLVEDCEWVHCGWVSSSSNRGGSKFAVTSHITLKRLWTHDHRGSGVWWDIKNEDGYGEDIVAEDCTRMGINLEVSYGPFQFVRPIMRRCGSNKQSSEGVNWPIPGGMQLSMTPDVTVTDPLVEDCRNGITAIQWDHPQIKGTIGSLDKSRCGNENLIVNGGKITRIAEWDAGLAGSHQAGTRPTKNIHWNNVQFDSDAKFRSSLQIHIKGKL